MKVETTQKDDEGNEYTDSEGIWFKNQDEFVISVAPSFKMSDNWSYGSILNFRSQFVNGYKCAYGTKGGAPQEQIHDPGLPRHLARYHL